MIIVAGSRCGSGTVAESFTSWSAGSRHTQSPRHTHTRLLKPPSPLQWHLLIKGKSPPQIVPLTDAQAFRYKGLWGPCLFKPPQPACVFTTFMPSAYWIKRQHWVPWNWSYRWVWTARWMLRIGCRSSVRAAGTLNLQPIISVLILILDIYLAVILGWVPTTVLPPSACFVHWDSRCVTPCTSNWYYLL